MTDKASFRLLGDLTIGELVFFAVPGSGPRFRALRKRLSDNRISGFFFLYFIIIIIIIIFNRVANILKSEAGPKEIFRNVSVSFDGGITIGWSGSLRRLHRWEIRSHHRECGSDDSGFEQGVEAEIRYSCDRLSSPGKKLSEAHPGVLVG